MEELNARECACQRHKKLVKAPDKDVSILKKIIIVLTLMIVVPVHANNSAITWYTGGDSKIALTPMPIDNSSSMVLAGTTSLKTLIVTVAKKNGPLRTNPIPVATDGSFNVRYLIKDGLGSYTITLSGSDQSNSLRYQGLCFITHTVKKALSADMLHLELNRMIIEYVKEVMGTTVGRGECWDLAQEALDKNLADWTRPTTFGHLLNPDTEEIKAGDIIQFRSLNITEHLPGGVTKRVTFGAPDHTAIVYKVLGKKRFTLAHQNVGGNRSVISGDVDFTEVTSGTYVIYRPMALMIQAYKGLL